MNQIRSGLEDDPVANVKYKSWHCTKHALKDLGNDILNGGKAKNEEEFVNYLGHKWNENPETGEALDAEGRSLKRVQVIIKKVLPFMRKGPLSVLEILLDAADTILDEYFDFWGSGTVKFILKSLPFRQKANLLYARIDQCFSVLPLWSLQLINIALNSAKCLKDTKLPYELKLLNKPLAYNLFQDRVFRMVDHYTGQKALKHKQPSLVNESIEKPGWFWTFMLKTLMASNISAECRKEIRRKNRETLRAMGIEQSWMEKHSGSNKILGHIAKAVDKAAPKGNSWARELSSMLEYRAQQRKEEGLPEKFATGKNVEDYREA